MIDCDEVAVRLMDYAMDDLDDDGCAAVDEHLHACPQCQQMVDEYRSVSDMVCEAMEFHLSDEDQAALDAAVLSAVAKSA
ncbi:MAG: hypothetical protein GXP62_18820 [Oligoflexia bacterium]|nr:hypothetical protein [Oligoflexia bacterium]